MGCDIHAFVESKEYDQYWMQTHPFLSRNYRMFGLMAGVRYPNIALYAPRELPIDIAVSTQRKHMEMQLDAHTSSFLSTKEFEQVVEVYGGMKDSAWPISPLYLATLAFMQQLEDARLVFWFDN